MRVKDYICDNYGIGKKQLTVIIKILGLSKDANINSLAKFEKKKLNGYLEKRSKILSRPTPRIGDSRYGMSHEGSATLPSLRQGESLPINKNLKYIVKTDIEYLIKLNNRKGLRHRFRLPVRGQRSKTNANTRKRLNPIPEL